MFTFVNFRLKFKHQERSSAKDNILLHHIDGFSVISIKSMVLILFISTISLQTLAAARQLEGGWGGRKEFSFWNLYRRGTSGRRTLPAAHMCQGMAVGTETPAHTGRKNLHV